MANSGDHPVCGEAHQQRTVLPLCFNGIRADGDAPETGNSYPTTLANKALVTFWSRADDHGQHALGWILHFGSMEHLCLLNLVRTRLALDGHDYVTAQQAVQDGLRLFHVELFCEQARLQLAGEELNGAESAATQALELATAVDCQFF